MVNVPSQRQGFIMLEAITALLVSTIFIFVFSCYQRLCCKWLYETEKMYSALEVMSFLQHQEESSQHHKVKITPFHNPLEQSLRKAPWSSSHETSLPQLYMAHIEWDGFDGEARSWHVLCTK